MHTSVFYFSHITSARWGGGGGRRPSDKNAECFLVLNLFYSGDEKVYSNGNASFWASGFHLINPHPE